MAFTWSERRINWYLDASGQCDFHQRLAREILPFLRAEDRVCDMGCGLGRLDLELAPHVAEITCVDTDAAVLERLAADAAARGIRNLRVRQCDAGQLQGQFDVVVMAFFGTPPSLMFSCLARTRRKLIRVMSISRGPAAASVSQAGGLQRETAEDVSRVLETAGYPFALRRCTLSFGQPLASVEDAAAFVRVSAPESTGQTVRSFLRNHLVPGRSSQFPWELPKEKELGIFVVDAAGKTGGSL